MQYEFEFCLEANNNLCVHPGIPIGGRLIASRRLLREGFTVGSTVRFECPNNLVLVGNDTVECTRIRLWSERETPVCVGTIKVCLKL